MNNPDMYLSFVLFHLHIIFASTAIVGGILFMYWAIKHLDKKMLPKWVAGLLVVGILGILLTAGLGWRAFALIFPGHGMMSMQSMMLDDVENGILTPDQMRDRMRQYMGY